MLKDQENNNMEQNSVKNMEVGLKEVFLPIYHLK